MTIKEMKTKIYEDYKEVIDAISIASKEVRPEGNWQADINVATDMFINFVDNNESSLFVNVAEAKKELAELRANLD